MKSLPLVLVLLFGTACYFGLRQESKRIDRLEKDVAEMRHDILANDATAFNRSMDSLHAITNLQVRLLRIWEQIYAIKGLPLPPESKP